MFREFRREKNVISVEEAKLLLKDSRRGVLAVNGDNGYPYAIPVNYLYDEENNKIYFHGARVGHKIDSLKASDKVCFTVCGPETIKAESWAPFVKSTLVFGRCHLMENNEQSIALLKQFAMKYYPSEMLVDEAVAVAGKVTQMFEIVIEHVTGKEVQEK